MRNHDGNWKTPHGDILSYGSMFYVGSWAMYQPDLEASIGKCVQMIPNNDPNAQWAPVSLWYEIDCTTPSSYVCSIGILMFFKK